MYVGGLLEKITTGSLVDWRLYIRVGGQLVAIMSRQSSGTNTTHYVLADHEGSLAKITDGTGATTVSESFSAFGTRRDPTSWSSVCDCADSSTIKSISREGFTGQDAIGGISMGLNHMNGRVQDAITGRFLSPDPTIPNPGNTQSFNRYSYTNNNPLTFTDPSGFQNHQNVPCVDNCNIPAGFGNLPPKVQRSMFGGEGGSTSDFSGLGNSGDGALGGVSYDPLSASNMNGSLGSAFYNNPVPASSVSITLGTLIPTMPASNSNGSLAQSQNATQSQDPLSPVVTTAQYLPSADQLPAITVTAQQGVFASFSTRVSSVVGVDLELNFASYVTPSNGFPYWSHGISVVLSLFRVKIGGSWQQASYDGGLSFQSLPSNFILGSFQASSDGVAYEIKSPQAFSGFTIDFNNITAPGCGAPPCHP